ncbi:MAG: hypothetical protein AAGB24_03855 [Bacteroidota bacterium]
MKKVLSKWFSSKSKNPTYSAAIENIDHILLIEGVFGATESADVLLSLLNYKIKFHTIQLLNLKDDTSNNALNSKKRIEELKIAKNRVTDMVIEARDNNQQLEIHSTINIILKNKDSFS